MSRTYTMQYNIEIADGEDVKEITATIEYEYHKESKGSREYGMQMEPDEPAYAEILNISDESGNEIDEGDIETNLDSIIEACTERGYEEEVGAYEAYCEAKADEMRDEGLW